MKKTAPAPPTHQPRARILVAEDRASLRDAMGEILSRDGHDVALAADGREAMDLLLQGGFDIFLFDLKLPVHGGLELLSAARERWPTVPVMVLTAYGSVETAVSAMKRGAFDFVSKPVEPDLLLVLVKRALESNRVERIGKAMEADLSRSAAFQGLVGESVAFKDSLSHAAKLAQADSTVLLLGETGVGKELFARGIHGMGPRKSQPFVAVNCAAIPSGLLENELFGHEKGAYTGAHEARIGKFELAHRGTLFLDEIGEMHPDLQSKVLRVIEDRTFFRVGGTQSIRSDVRLICATNMDIESAVESGRFRRDLYYRISALPIRIPPLRERPGDITLIARHYAGHFARELGKPGLKLTPDAESFLESQPWPGNVRELVNRLERAAILSSGEIGPGDLSTGSASRPSDMPASLFDYPNDPEGWMEMEERWRAGEVLKRCGGDSKRASRLLGITRERLEKLLGDLG